MLPQFLSFVPEYRDYIWGGQRLRPGILTAEAWIVFENDRVATGPLAGKTLESLTAEYGEALLGKTVVERRGRRFPLLIKLLDCNEWLSLQVHPNDQQAQELEGPGQNGKTEAWYFLEAAAGAKIIAGLKPGTTFEAMAKAIREGSILDLAHFIEMRGGETVFMRAGTIHALGPGLMVYEVQESSDFTYRVFDWNRPQTGRRVLHIDKSLAVADPAAASQAIPTPPLMDGEYRPLCKSEYFTLELLKADQKSIDLDTGGESFHALTVIEGAARLTSGGEDIILQKYETILVPAATGGYLLEPQEEGFKILRSGL